MHKNPSSAEVKPNVIIWENCDLEMWKRNHNRMSNSVVTPSLWCTWLTVKNLPTPTALSILDWFNLPAELCLSLYSCPMLSVTFLQPLWETLAVYVALGCETVECLDMEYFWGDVDPEKTVQPRFCIWRHQAVDHPNMCHDFRRCVSELWNGLQGQHCRHASSSTEPNPH